MSLKPLELLYERFSRYVEDRRLEPRDDVLTGLGHGDLPRRLAARGPRCRPRRRQRVRRRAGDHRAAARDHPELIGRASRPATSCCGSDPELIPNFVEEALRIESPLKGDFRLARRRIGGGRRRHSGRRHRDGGHRRGEPRPAQFDDPDEFRVDRDNAREHLAFGRGVHSCPGGSLARTETG